MKKIIVVFFLLFFSVSYAENIKIITREIKDSSVQYRYTTSAKFPQLEGLQDASIQKMINKIIYDDMKKGIDAFVTDMKEWDLSNIPDDLSSELSYTFTTHMLNENLFSFSFDVYSYYAGAAHPNHWSESKNFDLKTGKLMLLKSIFKPEVKYLEKVSKYCKVDLKNQAEFGGFEFDDFMLDEGTGPKDSNFINFNFTETGLVFVFNPYQVAPYVMGTQFVIIPYWALFEVADEKLWEKIPNF